MSEEPEITTFDLTCNDGTVFTLPSNHPEINIGGIGGVSYNAIMEDPAAIPAEFDQYCTFRPEPPPAIEPEPEIEPLWSGDLFDIASTYCDDCKLKDLCIVIRYHELLPTSLCRDCINSAFQSKELVRHL